MGWIQEWPAIIFEVDMATPGPVLDPPLYILTIDFLFLSLKAMAKINLTLRAFGLIYYRDGILMRPITDESYELS